MYFEAEKFWELSGSVGRCIPDQEKYLFDTIELSSNFNIIFVDVTVDTEEEGLIGNRYECVSVLNALEIINQENVKRSALSILSRRCDNDGDLVWAELREVIRAKDKSTGGPAFIYCGINGERFISEFSDSEDDLIERETIYFKGSRDI